MAEDKRNRPEQPQSGNQGPDRDRTETVNPAARSLPGPAALARKTRKSPRNSTSCAHGRRRAPPAVPRAPDETRAPSSDATPLAASIKRRSVAASHAADVNFARSVRTTLPRRPNDWRKRGYKFCNASAGQPRRRLSRKSRSSAKPSRGARRIDATAPAPSVDGTDFAFTPAPGAFPAVNLQPSHKEKCGHADLRHRIRHRQLSRRDGRAAAGAPPASAADPSVNRALARA